MSIPSIPSRRSANMPGQPLTGKGEIIVRQGNPGPLMPSPFQFQQVRPDAGWMFRRSFRSIAQHVDELAVLRSVYGASNDHVQATLSSCDRHDSHGFSQRGVLGHVRSRLGKPESAGIRRDLRCPRRTVRRPANWSAGFMPAAFQGTVFRSAENPIIDLKPPADVTAEQQRARLDLLAKLNALDLEKYPGKFRAGGAHLFLRTGLPDAGLRSGSGGRESRESEATRKLYGLDEKITEPFGRQCLMARRLVERGVRFVQLYHGGLGKQNTGYLGRARRCQGESHGGTPPKWTGPIAGLLTDLKARGLLDSTLVVWHGEFGRMPISQQGVGRDHNPGAMTVWMAGARIHGRADHRIERRIRL